MPNVTIENTVNNLLEFGLRLDSGDLRVIKLVPGDTVPNATWPDAIPDEQITEYLRELARVGAVKITPIIQAITIEFQDATSAFDRDTGTQQINVVVTTDDGEDTGEDVTVAVNDDGTGTGTEGDDYTFSPNPTILSIPAGTPSGTIFSVDVGLPSSTGPEETADFSLSDPTGAAVIGAQATHEMTINANVAPQTVTVQFTAGNFNFDNTFQTGDQNIGVSIITSDGNPLVAPVSVDVRDLLTGSAGGGTYSMTTPQTLNWSASEADGTVKNAVINVVAFGPDGTVDIDLDNASGASEGVQNTALVGIFGASS